MAKKNTIAFDYDAVQVAYEKMTLINEDALKLLEDLKDVSDDALEKMRGQYRKNYDSKSDDIIKNFKKIIKKVSKLSDKIQDASEDFWEKEMVLSESFEKH